MDDLRRGDRLFCATQRSVSAAQLVGTAIGTGIGFTRRRVTVWAQDVRHRLQEPWDNGSCTVTAATRHLKMPLGVDLLHG